MVYRLFPGQTLAGLCEELRIENPEYLLDFHNRHCPAAERSEGNLIGGTRFFIPTAEEVAEINRNIRENNESFYDFPADGRFPWNYPGWEGMYHISRTCYFNDDIAGTYEQDIRLDFEGVRHGLYHYLLTASDFRKNGDLSDSKISTLAGMCMENLYPVRMMVTPQGKIHKAALTGSPELLVSGWEAIEQHFEDHYALNYIGTLKKMAEDPDVISGRFSCTLLSSLLFGPFYEMKLEDWTGSPAYRAFYPWIAEAQPVCFELRNTLLPKEHPGDGFIRIRQAGISCDPRSLEDLFIMDPDYSPTVAPDEHSIDCEHYSEYTFSRKDYTLRRIEAVFKNFANGNTGKEVFLLERAADHS